MASTYVWSGAQGEPPPELKARVEAALGRRWAGHERPRTGLSAAHRFVVRLEGGEAVFAKAATTPERMPPGAPWKGAEGRRRSRPLGYYQ